MGYIEKIMILLTENIGIVTMVVVACILLIISVIESKEVAVKIKNWITENVKDAIIVMIGVSAGFWFLLS